MSTHMQSMNDWFESLPGSMVLDMERELIRSKLIQSFGEHILQMGGANHLSLLNDSPIRHKIFMGLPQEFGGAAVNLIGEFNELPILPKSLDVVILAHVLECVDQPEKVLAETYQALIPNGYCFIVGFNRWSLWNLWRFKHLKETSFPWKSRFRSIWNVNHMLNKIGFRVQESKTFCFRPPLHHKKEATQLFGLEWIGQVFFSNFGGVYMIVAQKQVGGFTPLKLEWATQNIHFSGFKEPSSSSRGATYTRSDNL